jgi:integrase
VRRSGRPPSSRIRETPEPARESLQKAQSGINPVEARRTSAAKAAQEAKVTAAETFAAGADRYLKEYVEKNTRPATVKETRRIIERDVKPRWAATSIRDIGRQDVNALLDEIADRGALVQANRTLARLKTLFSWALNEDLIDKDPTVGVRKRIKESARDRALSNDEIRLFWASCDKLGWPFGPMFKLLLLTGQRRDEVGTMEWAELDELGTRRWTIPREKAKNDRAHEVHLSELAVEIIDDLPKMSGSRRRCGLRAQPIPLHDKRRTASLRFQQGEGAARQRYDAAPPRRPRGSRQESGKG